MSKMIDSKLKDILDHESLESSGFKRISNYQNIFDLNWYENNKFVLGFSEGYTLIQFIYKSIQNDINISFNYYDSLDSEIIKNFIHAMVDPIKLPLFVNFDWAQKFITVYLEEN
jgi:hypothetical protein